MKSKFMAFLISALICLALGAIVFLLDLCVECVMTKIIATVIVVLWMGLYWWLAPVNTSDDNGSTR